MRIAKAMSIAAGIFACAHLAFGQDAPVSEPAIREQKVKFSASAFNPGRKQPHASISGDGRSLSFDCPDPAPKSRTELFRSKEGFFRGDTDYRISFGYAFNGGAGKLLLILRDSAPGAPEIFRATLEAKEGPQSFSARFRTPANAKKLSLLFAAADGAVSAEIKDLKAEYGAFETYVPATPKAEAFDESKLGMPLPSGAKEFEVDLPRGNGSSISAEHLGVEPGLAFLTSKINMAIETCRERGISRLVLPKAVYYIDEEAAITLKNLKDFELDGGGSTLVFNRKKGHSMSVSGCERVRIRNLNFDWDWQKDPLGSFVKVANVKSSDKESFVDFAFEDYREYPQKYVRIACLSQADPETRSVGVEGGRTYMWETWKSTPPKEKKWVSPNVLRVFLSKGEAGGFTKGEFFRMVHYYYDMYALTMHGNTHLTLENINVHSTPGHAFTVDGKQKYWQFKNVNIAIPDGESRRAVTCTADHLHIARSQGFFKMENCDFSFGNDDCMNAHDNSAYVKKTDAYGVCMSKKWEALTFRPGEKIEFRNTDMSPTGHTGEVAEVAEMQENPGTFRIGFKEPVPEEASEFVIFNRTYDTSNIIIRNSSFRQNRARGILVLARNVTVENCRFYRNEMGAMKFESGWTENSWCEGFGVNNVVVRGCEFDTVNPSGASSSGKARDIFMGAYIKTDPSETLTHYPVVQNVLFENNRFKDSFGAVAFISSAQNVIFKNNVFTNSAARNSESHLRGAFYVANSRHIRIVNNTYVDSPLLKKPGVMFESETCEDISAQGNLISQSCPEGDAETRPAAPPKAREYSLPTLPTFFPSD